MCEVWLQYIHINNTANIRIVVRRLYLTDSNSLSYTKQSAFRQVHSPFQNKFSTDPNLVFPFTIYGSCLHLFRLPPVTALLACNFPSTSCFVRQFLRKMWPIQLYFLHFISRTIFLSPLIFVSYHFSHDPSNWFSTSLLQNHIPKLSMYFWSPFRKVKFSAPQNCMFYV